MRSVNPLRSRLGRGVVTTAAALGLSAVAFAAVTVGTDLGGSTAVAESSASLAVSSVATSAPTGGLVCVGRTDGGRNIIVDTRAKVLNGEVGAQSCVVTATVRNESDETVKLTDVQLDPSQPALKGWRVVPQSGDPTIAPRTSNTYAVRVETGGASVKRADLGTGSFSGRLVGSAG